MTNSICPVADEVIGFMEKLRATMAALRAAGLSDPAGRQRLAATIGDGRALFGRDDIRADAELSQLADLWDALVLSLDGWPAYA